MDTFTLQKFNDTIFGCNTTNFTKYNVKCTVERFFASLNEYQNILAETMYTPKISYGIRLNKFMSFCHDNVGAVNINSWAKAHIRRG